MQRKTLALAIVAVALTITPAGLASAPQDPGTFMLRSIRQRVANDWAGAWTTLYPTHQRLAGRAQFATCEMATPWPAQLVRIRLVATRPALVAVAGLPRPVAGAAVTVEYTLRTPAFERDPFTRRHTFHLVAVDGRWRWILSKATYRWFASGGCRRALART